MADEKSSANVPEAVPQDEPVYTPESMPAGWKYRSRKVGPLSIPWYASPQTQLVMVSFVCFACPGMFNALSGLGGGGNTNQDTADNMVS